MLPSHITSSQGPTAPSLCVDGWCPSAPPPLCPSFEHVSLDLWPQRRESPTKLADSGKSKEARLGFLTIQDIHRYVWMISLQVTRSLSNSTLRQPETVPFQSSATIVPNVNLQVDLPSAKVPNQMSDRIIGTYRMNTCFLQGQKFMSITFVSSIL